jgi:hypothetical protein
MNKVIAFGKILPLLAISSVFAIAPFATSTAYAQWYDDYSFDGGNYYNDSYSFDGGNYYDDSYSFDGGNYYDDSYSFDNGNWYDDSYSYDGGNYYNDSYSYDGYGYGDSYSFDSGNWYDDNYSFDGGNWYDDSYSYDGNSGTYYDDTPGTYYDDVAGNWYDDAMGHYYDDTPGNYYDDVPGTYYNDSYPHSNGGCGWCMSNNMSNNWYSSYLAGIGAYAQPSYYARPSYSNPYSNPAPIVVTAPGRSRSSSSVVNNNIDNSINNSNNRTFVDNSIHNTNSGNVIGSYNYGSAVGNSGPTNVNVASVAPVSQNAQQYVIQQTLPSADCSITASPATIQAGASAYLSWQSYGASQAWLSDGIGNVAANGSMSVRPSTSRTYTLTVADGYGHTQSCTTSITVGGVAPIAPIHPAPAYPHVNLNQIPYTGFDFGPVGNAIYWGSLLSFAAAAAYLMIYYRGGAFAFAGSMFTRREPVILSEIITDSEENDEPQMETEQAEETAQALVQSTYTPAIELPRVNDSRRITNDSMVVAHSMSGEIPRLVITRN